jgi:anti-sigma B factor antagonist
MLAPEPMTAPSSPSVFSPEGAIDLHVSPELRASLRAIIDNEKPKRLVVDLSRVPYIDSSGIAVLIGAMQSLEHEGGNFLLAGAQEGVRMILESARLDQYFRLFPNVEAAVAAP